MKRAEIVIIGGGVVGASVAFHLTELGLRDIILLERETALGLGSTGKATGGIRAQFGTDINIKLSLYSLDFVRDWDFDCEYEPRGYVFLATNDEQLEFLRQSTKRQRELGYEDVEVIDPQTIAEIVPGLNCEDIVGGSFGRRDGFINPLAMLEGFITAAAMRGTRVKTTSFVRSIEVRNGRVKGVRTSDGTLECDNVVVCSGAWAKIVSVTAGIDLPVEPQRRQIVWARTSEPLPPELPMVIDLSDGFHFRPARDFSVQTPAGAGSDNADVLFAFPDPDEPNGLSTDFTDGFIDNVYDRARHRAPFLARSEVVREKCRAGLYENTPDHHAILGGCEIEGLYFANGFSGHGVMHSPATGRALAEIMLFGKADFLDVSCLHIDRFAKGELLHETAFI
jgi:sarcosine oxidase subunit beta